MARLRAPLMAAMIAGVLCGAASALSLNLSISGHAATGAAPAEPVGRALPALPADGRPVVAYGDSLTDGFGVTPAQSYPAALQALLGEPVIRRGFPGKGAAVGVAALPEILALQPRLVVVEFGSVDACLGVPMAVARDNLDTLLTGLDAHHVPAVIVGTHLGPERIARPPACLAWTPYLQDWDAALEALARRHGSGLVLDVLHGLGAQPDGFHPDVAGYAAMAERIVGTVEAVEATTRLPL
jgi:acyl-CoA thioesterase-1